MGSPDVRQRLQQMKRCRLRWIHELHTKWYLDMHMIKQRMAVAAEYIRHTLATHAQLDAGSSEVP